jgi:hypothetical protein
VGAQQASAVVTVARRRREHPDARRHRRGDTDGSSLATTMPTRRRSVLVLEAERTGGAVRPAELTRPGSAQDVFPGAYLPLRARRRL